MDNQLNKLSNARAVSFIDKARSTPQETIIIDLIKLSIENNKPITQDEIIEAYVTWKEAKDGILIEKTYLHHNPGSYHISWEKKEITRNEFAALWATKIQARTWFKSNLTGAIIKGKLLVIPIIEIE